MAGCSDTIKQEIVRYILPHAAFYSTAIQPLKKLLAIKYRFYRRLFDKDLTPSDGRQPIQLSVYGILAEIASIF